MEKEVRDEMIRGLRELRNYFMHNDRTPNQHYLFNLAERFINIIKAEEYTHSPNSPSPSNAVGLRWVKASERLPKIPGEYHIKFDSPRANGNRYGEVAVLGVDEKWRIYDRVADDHDDMFCDVDYWLEEYTPSLNSVEDTAKEKAEKFIEGVRISSASINIHRDIAIRKGYIAGFIAASNSNESDEFNECRKILEELVFLKSVKDFPEWKEEYDRRKPLAWAAAKDFVAGFQSSFHKPASNKESEDALRGSDWKWKQVLSIADKSVLIEKKTLEWCLSGISVLKTMLSNHNLTEGVQSSKALIETLTSALNKQHSLPPQPNKESEGERKFTLEEIKNTFIDARQLENNLDFESGYLYRSYKQYFKEKFNIDL